MVVFFIMPNIKPLDRNQKYTYIVKYYSQKQRIKCSHMNK